MSCLPGAETVTLEGLNHFGSGLSHDIMEPLKHRHRSGHGGGGAQSGGGHRLHRHAGPTDAAGPRTDSRRRLQEEVQNGPSISADLEIDERRRRRLSERWSGMFTKVLLWAPWGALDKIVYLDADHIVLSNVDRLFFICNDGLCGVLDTSQSNKMWDSAYVNAGLVVIEPNLADYHGLLDAVANNTLTTGAKNAGYNFEAYFSPESASGLQHSWFVGGKKGSLLEQDLLNVYFSSRITFLAPGYNTWAVDLKNKMVPGKLYETQAEVDKYVMSRLHVIHGNLWQATDGYTNIFPLETRRLWLDVWVATARKVVAAADSAGGGASGGDSCFLKETRKCVACDNATSDLDKLSCWFSCVEKSS